MSNATFVGAVYTPVLPINEPPLKLYFNVYCSAVQRVYNSTLPSSAPYVVSADSFIVNAVFTPLININVPLSVNDQPSRI